LVVQRDWDWDWDWNFSQNSNIRGLSEGRQGPRGTFIHFTVRDPKGSKQLFFGPDSFLFFRFSFLAFMELGVFVTELDSFLLKIGSKN